MHDVARMSHSQPSCDLDGQVERLANGDRSAREFLRESFSLVVAHDDEELAVFGLFDPVNHADVGMIQRGSGARLAEQAFSVAVAHGGIRGQEFQRYGTLQLQIERLIHYAHATGADFLGDSVMRDGLTDHDAGKDCG